MGQHPPDSLQWLLDELRQENPTKQSADELISLISKIVCKCHHIPSKDQHDVVMKAALRVYRQRDTFGGRSKISSWICGIIKNVIREHLRDQDEEPLSLESVLDALPHDVNPEDVVLNRMAAEEALNTLTTEERQIVVLHLDGLNYNEIGAQVNRTGNNVGKILRFSVARKLAEYLKIEGWIAQNSDTADKGSQE